MIPFFNKINILRIVNNGALQRKNVTEKNKIQILNVISISVYFLTLIATGVYLIYGFYWIAFFDIIIISIFFINKIIIRNGHFLFAKMFGLQGIFIYLFLSGAFYGYPITFTHFYLIAVVACLFVFSASELYYMIFCIAQFIAMFFLQALYPEHLFSVSLNILSPERKELLNVIFLLTMSTFLFSLVFLIVLIIQIQEQKLKKLKTRLFLVKKTLTVQNNELQTFGLAATHSLKTPLFIINSFLNKIESNVNNKKGQHNDYYFNLVKESNQLNEKYSNDLISYLSIYNIVSNLEVFNLHQFVEKCNEIYKVKYKEALIINDTEDMSILSNPLLLEIIIQNMVDNALKYNVSDVPEIKIYTKKNKNIWSVFFEDNGIGISKDYATKIFDPFNRINEIETSAGSGLGLTISKLAAFKMNATLDLYYSSKENGSIFKVDLTDENEPH